MEGKVIAAVEQLKKRDRALLRSSAKKPDQSAMIGNIPLLDIV